MQCFRLSRCVFFVGLAVLPGLSGAAPISGKVADLLGKGLKGGCISLSTSDSLTISDPTGNWLFLANGTSGLANPSLRHRANLTKHLVLDGERVRLQFNGIDGLGRRLSGPVQVGAIGLPTPVVASRSAAAADSLEFSWNGKVRARVALDSWVAGTVQKIDTSATAPTLTCNTASCKACADPTKTPNILISSSFDKDTLPWYSVAEWIGVKKLSIVNGELQMGIVKGSNEPWHIMLQRAGMPVEAGKAYAVKLDARTSKLPFKLVLNIQASVGHGVVLATKVFNLATTTKSFFWDFQLDQSDPAAMIQFNMGGQGDDLNVTIDNFQIFEEAL